MGTKYEELLTACEESRKRWLQLLRDTNSIENGFCPAMDRILGVTGRVKKSVQGKFVNDGSWICTFEIEVANSNLSVFLTYRRHENSSKSVVVDILGQTLASHFNDDAQVNIDTICNHVFILGQQVCDQAVELFVKGQNPTRFGLE